MENINLEEKRKTSYILYFCMVFVLCLCTFLFDITAVVASPMDHSFNKSGLSKLLGKLISNNTLGLINAVWRLFAYGIMGLLGLYLSFKTGFNDIINNDLKQPKNIFIILTIGIVMGIFFVVYQVMADKIFEIYILKYTYSEIPASIFASIAEGIGCQILNMFCIVFLMWVLSKMIESEKRSKKLFWIVGILAALIFTIEHVPTTMRFSARSYSSVFDVSLGDFMIMLGLFAPLSLVCSCFLRRFGLLSAITIHVISDLIWRVLWPWNAS